MDTITVPDGRKLLAEYLAGKKQAEFARRVGCSESHLSLVLSGARGVSLGLAKRICEATGGEVPVEALPHQKAPECERGASEQ